MLSNCHSSDDDTSALYCVYEVESAKLKVESWRDNRGLLEGQASQLLRRIPVCVGTAFWLSENERITSKQCPVGREMTSAMSTSNRQSVPDNQFQCPVGRDDLSHKLS